MSHHEGLIDELRQAQELPGIVGIVLSLLQIKQQREGSMGRAEILANNLEPSDQSKGLRARENKVTPGRLIRFPSEASGL